MEIEEQEIAEKVSRAICQAEEALLREMMEPSEAVTAKAWELIRSNLRYEEAFRYMVRAFARERGIELEMTIPCPPHPRDLSDDLLELTP